VDVSGNLYVTDHGDKTLKEVVAAGGYTTVVTLASGFFNPVSIALDSSGNIYAVDDDKPSLVKLHFADAPKLTFATTTFVGLNDNTDGPETVSVWNIGNAHLSFPSLDRKRSKLPHRLS
jgi:hypothetical protein